MVAPLAAVPILLLTAPDSDLFRFLEEARGVAHHHPEILVQIDADLDRHSLNKKKSGSPVIRVGRNGDVVANQPLPNSAFLHDNPLFRRALTHVRVPTQGGTPRSVR